MAPLNRTWLFTCDTAEDQEPVLYCLVSVYVSKRCTLYHQLQIQLEADFIDLYTGRKPSDLLVYLSGVFIIPALRFEYWYLLFEM